MSRLSQCFIRPPRAISAAAIACFLVFAAGPSFATPCSVPDNGSGTVNLPPAGCGYVSPAALHMIINGLPAGTTITVGVQHQDFFNVTTASGGPLGGEQETFSSGLLLHLTGTGTLSSYTRTVNLQAQCQTSTAPRTPGASPQSFDTDMAMIQGQLPPGDPDFDLLRITAGTNFGMPSPGHTTLTRLSDGNWNIDSFFDITYRIDFVGHAGGPLGGMSGSTTGTIRMRSGVAMPVAGACVVPNTGGGTVNLPPPGCGYVSPHDLHVMINGLPPGTSIHLAASHEKFTNVTRTPGGALGGETENFGSQLVLQMSGTGTLSTYSRTVVVPTVCQSSTAPRTLGAAVQSFDTQMQMIQGQLPAGDPDFDLLRVTAGDGFGLPSPGHTTLTLTNDGNWNIDSFFDITYRIDFVGHPGGPLGGMSGSTTGTIRMGTGVTAPPPPGPCVVAMNPDGSVNLPPAGCGYLSPADVHMMINGLPAGTTLHLAAQHAQFFNVTTTPDATGGAAEQFGSVLVLTISGTGDFASYGRTLTMQAQCQSHTNAHDVTRNIQSFDTEMMGIQGQLPPGDPDFDLLRITAGSGFGMPSPGHTTLTRQPTPPGTPGQYNIDSFFDITYRIDFVGHPGGPFSGMSGSTTGTIRMQTGQPTLLAVPNPERPSSASVQLSSSPNPFSPTTTIQYRLPAAADVNVTVFDATGRKVRELTDARLPAGPHAVLWDGRADSGRRLGTGTYFIKLTVGGEVIASKKAVLVR